MQIGGSAVISGNLKYATTTNNGRYKLIFAQQLSGSFIQVSPMETNEVCFVRVCTLMCVCACV